MTSYQHDPKVELVNQLLKEAGFKVRYKENNMEKNEREIGALWEKTGAKGKYYTGTVNGEKVVAFLTGNKEPKPQIKILKEQPRDF